MTNNLGTGGTERQFVKIAPGLYTSRAGTRVQPGAFGEGLDGLECDLYTWTRVREQWLEVYGSLDIPMRLRPGF